MSVPVLAATEAEQTQQPLVLSDEQQALLDAVDRGSDVIVDATVGSGKTSAIQALCGAQSHRRVLYLTYSKLLKLDAQSRVVGASKVQNYHGIVYPSLLRAGIKCGVAESIHQFNENFKHLSVHFEPYDLLVVDEYQDITEEYARLLQNIKSVNPLMQTVVVGDYEQKLRSDTTLDVQRFVTDFCEDPVRLPFTQSFRMGPQMAALLGEAWNKPITGVNTEQSVEQMSFKEAFAEITELGDPGRLLCLGKRNGQMSRMLNLLETEYPEQFNKETVFASIRDGESNLSYGDDTAVFTTFDGAKGLEREVCFVFNYDEQYWDLRNRFAHADPVVLRNVFLVAASRGKSRIIFVDSDEDPGLGTGSQSIGAVPVSRFTDLPEVLQPEYEVPFFASECFDFTYAENVRECIDLLDLRRLDDAVAATIEIERQESLIDLSPTVGHYQEALYFDDYNPHAEVLDAGGDIAELLAEEITEDPWRNSLVLTAVSTEQMRYVDQVKYLVPERIQQQLISRLAEQLPRDALIQQHLLMQGAAVQSASTSTPISFQGIADAIHDGAIYELKFVGELSHAMFLQLGLYLVMGDYERGVLWNTRTGERWEVRIPNTRRFMNAVIRCVTKQSYRVFAEHSD